MNDTLIKNWNKLVQWGDDGYILGDFGMRHPFEYLWQLHGNVTIIRGNHDREIPRCLMKPYEFIMVDSVKFLLIHNYLNAYETGLVPPDWEGWIIFGHHHKKQPFMRRYMNRRLINVSVEVTDYKPISLARLVELIKNGEGK
jgi:calcineurin-like phosphoesterase family protein